MARIKLIVTGDAEEEALHTSLRRLYPDQRAGEDVVWDTPRRLHGATTHRLLPGGAPSKPMQNLARAMLDEVGIGKRGAPADLVVVVDDAELGNMGHEDVVSQHFCRAVAAHLDTFAEATRARYRMLLQTNCSFHLLRPMVEAYFFGDTAALQTAGVASAHAPRLVHPDVEQFESNDPQWLPACQAHNAARLGALPWWRHERHPKHYLEHLAERSDTLYEETDHGKRALASLGWTKVPKSAAHTPGLRALVEDISDWFGIPSPLRAGTLHPHLYPARTVDRADLLLRNL